MLGHTFMHGAGSGECAMGARPWLGDGKRKAPWIGVTLICFSMLAMTVDAFSIKELVRVGSKRRDDMVICPHFHPFQCPNGDCIPIKYLCDGSPDCSDEYDENKSMCTAGKHRLEGAQSLAATRPPVEETAAFLKALLNAHGNDFLVKLFGPKARNQLKDMGGVDQVSVALSQSPTIEQFGTEMKLNAEEMDKMGQVLEAIISGAPTAELAVNEAADFRFFVQKLQETGFF